MRDGKWKLHLNGRRAKATVELFDLSEDPSEMQNVADQNPAVVNRLRTKLEAWVAELPRQYEKSAERKSQSGD